MSRILGSHGTVSPEAAPRVVGHVRPLRLRLPARPDRRLLRRRPMSERCWRPATTWRPPTTSTPWSTTPDGDRRLEAFHWGLVPVLGQGHQDRAQDDQRPGRDRRHQATPSSGRSKQRRCIIPADGFYEWQKRPGAKREAAVLHPPPRRRAARLRRAVGGVAGQPPAPTRRGCTRARSSPRRPTRPWRPIHDRMPVILPPTAWERLARPGQRRPGRARRAAGAGAGSLLRCGRCRPTSNNVRNKGAHLIDEVEPEARRRARLLTWPARRRASRASRRPRCCPAARSSARIGSGGRLELRPGWRCRRWRSSAGSSRRRDHVHVECGTS